MIDGHHEELRHRVPVVITEKVHSRGDNIVGAMALGTILSLREQLESAHIDSVTQLPTRHSFNERFNRHFWREHKRPHEHARIGHLVLMVGDLDKLKDVNDNYGHLMGDRYLYVAAQAFQSALKPQDSVYRIGGDEFAAIMPNFQFVTDDSAAELNITKERVRLSVHDALAREELPQGLRTGISLGIDMYRSTDYKPVDMVSRVDEKMYLDKNADNIFV